jgi:hypothetical protein
MSDLFCHPASGVCDRDLDLPSRGCCDVARGDRQGSTAVNVLGDSSESMLPVTAQQHRDAATIRHAHGPTAEPDEISVII